MAESLICLLTSFPRLHAPEHCRRSSLYLSFFEDIQIELDQIEEDSPVICHLTKRHATHARLLGQYRQRCDMRDSLQGLLLPCLVLALPCGGSGASVTTAAGGDTLPAKALRRSAH